MLVCGGSAVFKSGVSGCCRECEEEETEAQGQYEVGRPDVM